MSCHRPTPRRHHAPNPHQLRLHGRPKEDLDGAARMSCTRHRRGAPWPPATATWGDDRMAAAVELLAPARPPAITSSHHAPLVLSSLVLQWRWENGRGRAVGCRLGAAAAQCRREGTRQACSARWPPRPPPAPRWRARSTPPPWEASVKGRE
jgi:hypothetical protein